MKNYTHAKKHFEGVKLTFMLNFFADTVGAKTETFIFMVFKELEFCYFKCSTFCFKVEITK